MARQHASTNSSSSTTLRFFAKLQQAVARIAYPAEDRLHKVEKLCGLDAAYSADGCGAAAVVYDLVKSEVVEEVVKTYPTTPAPYVPGFLFLREGPPLLDVVSSVRNRFDVLLVDGHGRAHPRRCGSATILGFVAGLPSIGVAKSLLVGSLQPSERYDRIVHDGEVVGLRRGPAYYSQGFGVSFNDVVRVSEVFGESYPEALRRADRLSRKALKKDG